MSVDPGHAAQRRGAHPARRLADRAPPGRPAHPPAGRRRRARRGGPGRRRRRHLRRPRRRRPGHRDPGQPDADRRADPRALAADPFLPVDASPGSAATTRPDRSSTPARSRTSCPSSAPPGPTAGGPRRSGPPATTRTAARRQIREYVLRFADTGGAEQASLKRAYADLAASCPATVDPSEGTSDDARSRSPVAGARRSRAALPLLPSRVRLRAELLRGRDRPPGQRRRRPGVAGVGQPVR